MRLIKRAALISLVFIAAAIVADTPFIALSPPKAHAGAAQDFNRAWHDFHNLLKKPNKAKYRSSWEPIRNKLIKIYRSDPDGSYAPKSIYYLGRVYEELGKRSYLRSDFEMSVEYYTQVATLFPNHTWTDDALLRAAKIHRDKLNDDAQAYVDLLHIVHNYPKGDMRPEAEEMLRQLDRANAKENGYQPPPIPEEQPAAQPQAETESEENSAGLKPNAPQPTATASNLAELEKVRYYSGPDYTRVVLDLDARVTYAWQMLKPQTGAGQNHRLFIDLQNTRLGNQAQNEVPVGDGILKRVRTGQNTTETARVVLDIQNLDDVRVFSLLDPYRVVIDVFSKDQPKQEPVTQTTQTASAPAQKPKPSASKPAEPYKPPPGSEKHAASLVEQLGLTIKTIMIDPGHGGKDPGAQANGLTEKDVNLRLARILGQKLKAQGFNVLYTRTDDTFIPLEERTAMANAKKADLFISLHCNWFKDKSVHGLEVYSLNLAQTKDAVRVAARENAVSQHNISDLQVILTDLMLSSKIKESRDLALISQKTSVASLKRNYSIRDRGAREAPFYVLMGAQMPAILIEMGYISNPTEAQRLKSDQFLGRMADGITQSVLAYKQKLETFASSQ